MSKTKKWTARQERDHLRRLGAQAYQSGMDYELARNSPASCLTPEQLLEWENGWRHARDAAVREAIERERAKYQLNDAERANLAIDILGGAEIMHEFEDCYWVMVDREEFDRFCNGG